MIILAPLATCAHFNLERQGERAIEKEIKCKATTSQNRKLPFIQSHCCNADPDLTSLQAGS